MLNADCKSHWLTNEEIKDGKKIRKKDGDSNTGDCCVVVLMLHLPMCLKQKNFLTTLLTKKSFTRSDKKKKIKSDPQRTQKPTKTSPPSTATVCVYDI